MVRSLKAREFARSHPSEPWLWDRPWTLETVAPQVARPAMGWLILALLLFASLLGGLGGASYILFTHEKSN